MGRRIVGVTVERQLVTVPVAGPIGCATDMECVRCESGSGSGSGSGNECAVDCDQCPDGTSEVWLLSAPDGQEVPLVHVDDPEDGNYCTWVSDDLDWRLQYDYGDDVWVLDQFSTGYLWTIDSSDWNCLGENVLVSDDPTIDDVVVDPLDNCEHVTYNCVDGSCVSVAGTGGTYATLAECSAACGSGVATDCCPDDLVSRNLVAAWSNPTGGCVGCLVDLSLSVIPGTTAWKSPLTGMCPTSDPEHNFVSLTFQCNEDINQWVASFDCAGYVVSFTPVSASCSPFRYVFDVTFTPFGGGPKNCFNGVAGTARLTITGS